MPENATLSLAAKTAEAGRWLALETSGYHGSIAAAEVTRDACRVVAFEPLSQAERSAQSLAPAVDALLKRLGWEPASLANVAVAVGPGSFTGLRVGVVTAKALAYATGSAVLGVDTLDALAEAAAPTAERLWTVIDAQRRECFLAMFERDTERWQRTGPNDRRTQDDARDALTEGDSVVGPIASLVVGERAGVTSDEVEPLADAVLTVAWRRWLAGESDDVFELAPRYHRPSAAEEKLAQ